MKSSNNIINNKQLMKGIAACFLCQFNSYFNVYHKPGYNIIVTPAHAKTSMTRIHRSKV
jgi:hypothetical protein